MATIIRLLMISVPLLILPARATPPVRGSHPMARSSLSVGRETVLVKRYLVLERMDGETKTRVRLYDIVLFVTVDQVVVFEQQPPNGPREEFSTRIRKVRPINARENTYGSSDACPVLPVF